MADEYAKPATATPRDEDVHAEALRRYETGYNFDQANILAAYEDLDFCIEEKQWSDDDKRRRVNRPILTVDKTGQFVRQVTGDIRQMRPAIKVVPTDDRAIPEVAEDILPGMIRYIEQRSDAQAAYFIGADSQVRAGIGHWRVLAEYQGTDTFLQELRIAPIDDGVSVIWDPDGRLPTREDAKWCFVPVDMQRDTFEERWPDKSADSLSVTTGTPGFFADWWSRDTIRVAEYWRKVKAVRRLAMAQDGGIDDVTDDPEAEQAAIAAGAKIEERNDYKVQCYFISASEVLEGPHEHPGRHIPIVPVIGEEIRRGKSIIRRGIIRGIKDVQRIYNYGVSQQSEVIALQPKAPFLGTEKNFSRTQDQWEMANTENLPFLIYDPDPANGNRAPERVAPPVSSQGIDDLLNRASMDFNAVTGIYPPALGAQSNETSGRAIIARQREGDTGTYLYVDNFARAVRRTGQILIDLIPHIYDTQRTIRIVGEDGKVDKLQINQAALDQTGMGQVTLNDVTVGTYDIAIEMGPSYTTKREEARDGMQAFMQAAGPQVAGLYIDLFAKMQDWPLADKIAKRAQMLLPAPIQAMEAQESGQPPPMPLQGQGGPPPPTPEQQLELAKMQRDGQLAMAKNQRETAAEERQQEIDRLKAEAALATIRKDMILAETALLNAQMQQQAAVLAEQERQAMAVEKSMQPQQFGLAGTKTSNVNGTPTLTITDPRVDQISESVAGLASMMQEAIQAIAELRKPPPDYMPAIMGVMDKIAARKTPIGVKRTRDGMQVIYDETPMLPRNGPLS